MIRQIPIIAILLLTPGLILAADSSESGISWGFVIMNLLGGLALFLYGMERIGIQHTPHRHRGVALRITSHHSLLQQVE